MKPIQNVIIFSVLCAALLNPRTMTAHEGHEKDDSGIKVVSTGKVDPAWLAKAKADYPVTACVVSDDKLEGGDMGPPVDYVYKVDGKPDRLVRLCCDHCVRDFKKNPAKYLKMVDDAVAAKKAASPETKS